MPFDDTTLVYKIGGRMFACADIEPFRYVAVKCDPDEALVLREQYPEIEPAYHFNKRHWNGISTSGDLPDAFIREQIRNSYRLVLNGVSPRSLRLQIEEYVARVGLPE